MIGNSFLVFLHAHSGAIFVALLLSLAILGAIYWYLRNSQDISEKAGWGAESPSIGLESCKVAPSPEQTTYKALQEELATHQNGDTHTGNITAPTELMVLAEELKKIRQSAKDSEMIDDVKASFHHVIDAGKSALAAQEWERAKKYFEEALKCAPNHPEISVNLAIACYESGDLKGSEKYYQAACQQHPLAGNVFRKHLALRL